MTKNKIFFFIIFLFFNFNLSAQAIEPPALQLANVYNKNIELRGYFVSEKYDGVRAFWNGEKLISRQGNIINAPTWFTQNFPKENLDGELWIARQKFDLVSGIARQETPNDQDWKQIKYMVFDLPRNPETFENRVHEMEKIISAAKLPHLQMVKQSRIYSEAALQDLLIKTVKGGGEGLMLRKADSLYKAARNNDLIKVKTYQDSDAVVLRYVEGKGKYTGMVGALIVENKEDKVIFSIGSGLTDEQRKNPPKIGSSITYKYQGKTLNNLPRFPVFLRQLGE